MSTINNQMNDVISKIYGGSGSSSNDLGFLSGMRTVTGAATQAYDAYVASQKETDSDSEGNYDDVSVAESKNSAGVYSKNYVPYIGAGKYSSTSAPSEYSKGKTISYLGNEKYGASYASDYLEKLNKESKEEEK
jgi:hypothetical protein